MDEYENKQKVLIDDDTMEMLGLNREQLKTLLKEKFTEGEDYTDLSTIPEDKIDLELEGCIRGTSYMHNLEKEKNPMWVPGKEDWIALMRKVNKLRPELRKKLWEDYFNQFPQYRDTH